MKKILFTTLICLSLTVTSEEINDYQETLVHSFDKGSENNQLGFLTGEEGWGASDTDPRSINFDRDDNLIIGDAINGRTIIYNKDFSVKKIYKDNVDFSSSKKIWDFDDNLLFGVSGSSRHFILNKNNGISKEINIPYKKASIAQTASVFTEKVIFSYLRNHTIVSFVLEDLETLDYSEMLNTVETKKLFNNRNEYSLEGYEIKNNKLFYNGVILNNNYKDLYQYWDTQHKKNNQREPRKVPGVPSFSQMRGGESTFYGVDNDRNSYFYIASSSLVFDKDGWVLDGFLLDNHPICLPVVNSKGDIYYLARGLDSNNKVVLNLYKIERQW